MYDVNGKRYDEANTPLMKQQPMHQYAAASSSVPLLAEKRKNVGFQAEGRSFNDIIFGIVFILFLAGMGVISFVGFSKGNPANLLPTDQWPQSVIDKLESKGEFWLQDGVAYLKRDLDFLGGSLGFSLLLAIVWIQLLRMFPKLFIYMTMFLGVMAISGVGVYLLVGTSSVSLHYVAYASFLIAFLLILTIFFLRNKIHLTSLLFTEATQGVQHNPAIFLTSLMIIGLLSAFVVYWMATAIYLFSIPGNTAGTEDLNIPSEFHFDVSIRYLMLYQVFGFFWVVAFLGAVFQMSVAGAISCWYFSRSIHGPSYNGSPALQTFVWAFSKSFGSLAFGSLILAIVQFINFLLEQARRNAGKNAVLKCIISCIICIFSCIQALVRFVNRFAYVYIGMHGDSFCTAARECFDMISGNGFSVVAVDWLSGLVLFVGKLFGTAVTAGGALGIMNLVGRQVAPLTIIVIGVLSFVVFGFFASILQTGIDTVFVCWIEEQSGSNGDAQGLYISPELHRELMKKKQPHENN